MVMNLQPIINVIQPIFAIGIIGYIIYKVVPEPAWKKFGEWIDGKVKEKQTTERVDKEELIQLQKKEAEYDKLIDELETKPQEEKEDGK